MSINKVDRIFDLDSYKKDLVKGSRLELDDPIYINEVRPFIVQKREDPEYGRLL